MKEINEMLNRILQQEKELVFKSFSNNDAWEIGSILVENAKKNGYCIAIDINRNGQQLFHYAFSGTTCNHDNWLRGKSKTVNYFGTSSLYIQLTLQQKELSIDKDSFISEREFFACGGAFPIIIEDTGVIGAIAVSGLQPEEDHEFVVAAIRQYLNKKTN